ncbi:hypothetical protein VTO42DRAFT_8057 [Malbranchea cinnamomea]
MAPFLILDSEDESDRGRPRQTRRIPAPRVVDDDSSDTVCEDPAPPRRQRRCGTFTERYSEEDFMTDEDFDQYLTELSINAAQSRPHDCTPPAPTRVAITSYTCQGKTYRKDKSVELHDGTFLRIQQVLQDEKGEIFLVGRRFERLETMDSLVPRRINELCWIINLYPGDDDSKYDEIALSEVKGMRIIRLTNYLYPAMSVQSQPGNNGAIRREGMLYCRLKYIRIWGETAGKKQRIIEEALMFLSPEEADPGFKVGSDEIRHQWRGATRLGGSYIEHQRGQSSFIDLSGNSQPPASRRRTLQMYTFGDGFCGAGGVSRGAEQAGLKIQWGFDYCHKAMETYRMNFPTATGWTCEVSDFLTNDPDEIRVDILHFSPPCKTFSPAKTVAAATDDANEACIFSTRELLDRVKPRIATMEETPGLQERHKEFLNATIHNFVDLGYSLRWKVLDCQDYGVPQRRKRLVIIGSGPGEILPTFPPATHGPPESGLLPYRTIFDAISGLASNAPNHEIDRCIYDVPKPPFNPHTFAKTVTCNGGENYHPSGTRTYTHREAACLQTFPLEHRFCGVGVLKQIGNAVPPMLAKAIFRQVVKQLERTDGIRGRPRL